MLSNRANKVLISCNPSVILMVGMINFLPFYGNAIRRYRCYEASGISAVTIRIHQRPYKLAHQTEYFHMWRFPHIQPPQTVKPPNHAELVLRGSLPAGSMMEKRGSLVTRPIRIIYLGRMPEHLTGGNVATTILTHQLSSAKHEIWGVGQEDLETRGRISN